MAPADGKILPMEQARDEAFASCAMGNGIVILPSNGEVTAPCDGTITTILEPSLHAVGIETEDGINILIHIGIDTVKMEGDGFTSSVSVGQKVKAGDPLISMDLEKVKKDGYLPDVMMVVLEEEGMPSIKYHTKDTAKKGKTKVAEY